MPDSDATPPADTPPFSVIIPCFNEQGAILQTIEHIRAALRGHSGYELIIVNDASTDGTADLLAEAASADPTLKVIEHETNRGYGAALKSGLREAIGELIVITDADGTYPNDRIPDLLEQARHADMVVGARLGDDVEYPLSRRLPKMILVRYASWMAGVRIPDMNSGLRVFRRTIAERFIRVLPDGFSFTTTITLAMLTNHYRVRFVPVSYSRRIGRSKIQPVRDTLRIIQLILRTAVYFAPLRAFAPIIAALALGFIISTLYDVFVLRNLTDKTVILLMFTLNTSLFALLADMIDKRSQ